MQKELTFIVGEGSRSDGDDEDAERGHDADEIHLGGLRLLGFKGTPQLVDGDGREVVEALTD